MVTNTEFVRGLMENGNPLRQVIILKAIKEYTDKHSHLNPFDLDEMDKQNPFVSAREWSRVCADIREEITDRRIQQT